MHERVATTPSLTIKRRLNATPAEVFEAWTDPRLLMQWFGPENVVTQEVSVDARIGGGFRVVMLEDTGERHEVSGTYYEVVANEKLVFSWSWITTPERVSQVTVTFKPDGAGTILTLLHEQLFDEQAVKGHTHGWTGSLAKLESLFA
ncbi:SRPBCC domain-containing protein [Bosea sp. R86505]|uniref:SRPBCC family protein n=1 Tax=Bosea sp. R86505 TaxID=3101710 RepID=UPI00366E0BC8